MITIDHDGMPAAEPEPHGECSEDELCDQCARAERYWAAREDERDRERDEEGWEP
jgi:hypothetical protein